MTTNKQEKSINSNHTKELKINFGNKEKWISSTIFASNDMYMDIICFVGCILILNDLSECF
jgi:hypothetical protein